MLARGVVVDRPRPAADQRDQRKVRQPFDQRAREIDPLANFDDAFGGTEPLDQLVEIARRRPVARHLMPAEQPERVELVDDVLIVVGNDDLHAFPSMAARPLRSLSFIRWLTICYPSVIGRKYQEALSTCSGRPHVGRAPKNASIQSGTYSELRAC